MLWSPVPSRSLARSNPPRAAVTSDCRTTSLGYRTIPAEVRCRRAQGKTHHKRRTQSQVPNPSQTVLSLDLTLPKYRLSPLRNYCAKICATYKTLAFEHI